ncbi:hypothetical protein [Plantactinospora soyae]|uniref:Laminin G domain-containing protein n=1 Tax=Plantactinospora soyae TaxID=1544732 RepID=A0A927MIK8_9ACTN|nr:hypothetical protein [Plantactinospora soyae]MBE1491830.1 hypothetical protein [Plantactinospora soyae]
MSAEPGEHWISGAEPGERPPGVPDLDEVAGEWVEAAELAHLPSLRNQRGQAHVNHDLTSLSWLAAPPYSFGYHTGVLRVDGTMVDAQRFRWKPWGVRREHRSGGLSVCTDTRLALAEDVLLWQIEITNERDHAATVTVEQDLFAPVAHSEIGWGWLYNVPWNGGDHHDYHSLERIRDTTRAGRAETPYLLGSGSRRLRLGRPRQPGIQRDDDVAPMLLEHELPQHVSVDTVYPHRESAKGTLRALRCARTDADAADPAPADAADPLPADAADPVPTDAVVLDHPAAVDLDRDSAVSLDEFELRAGLSLGFEFRPASLGHAGILLTHGNHPDSLQLGLDGDRLWIGICGEREYADQPLRVGQWHGITVVVGDHGIVLRLDGRPVARTGHWSRPVRWASTVSGTEVSGTEVSGTEVSGTEVSGATVEIADRLSPARARYAFATPPSALVPLGVGATATWTLPLGPGQTRTLGVVCAYGTDPAVVATVAARTAAALPATMSGTEQGMRRHWANMFTPGNDDFSGHLPTLRTANADLSRAYYMGALVALYLRNLTASPTEPVFLTGGPRLGPTTTFYWDHTEWSRMYALLEPAGLRSWLLRALTGPYDASFGFDVRGGGPLGNNYSSNHYSLFRLTEHYVCVTGDLAFLDEPAGAATVAEHLERLAYGWRDRRDPATGGVLADFGDDSWQLLECVPNYTNVVAGFNAAYVGMLRSLAGLLRFRGRDDDAERARVDADRLAAAVLDLYAGSGRWQVRHPGGTDTIGHSLDFGLVAAALGAELTERQRTEMVTFAVQKLLRAPWMRALAADDPIAPFCDRADHGASGAFCAWPGVTAYGLARLGRRDLAIALLGATPGAASGALWGQAMELVEDDPGRFRVRVAELGVANRDSIGGAATAEAVLSGLFGIEPSFVDLGTGTPVPPGTVRCPDVGELTNLNITPAHLPAVAPR